MSLLLMRNNLGRLRALRNLCVLKDIPRLHQIKYLHVSKQICKRKKELVLEANTDTIKKYDSKRKYTGLWKAERFAGIGLIFLIPLAFYAESKEIEMALAVVGIMHTYWGCQSMCNDYVRSAVVGKYLPVAARCANITLAIASLIGLHHLIYEDCGLVNMIKKFWAIRGKDYVEIDNEPNKPNEPNEPNEANNKSD